jgi:threonine dehydrogenase-like Zn-dependent dehydrogenase
LEKTRCAVWTGGREFRIDERPVPEPGPGQVRVRVDACGVCLTDVHRADGYFGAVGEHFGLQPPPCVLGHEFGGRVDAIGPDVRALEPGMPVACWASGGFADRAIVPAERAFWIPAGVPADEAVFVEPIACCVTAVQNGRIPPGGTVLVTGAGPMGLIVLQLARRGGAARVLVSEPNPRRRELAARLGADRTIDPGATSLVDAVRELAPAGKVDVAFEAAGHPSPLRDCLAAVADNGTVVMVGVPPATAHLDLELYPFHRRNLTLTGTYGASGSQAFRSAVNWLGQLDLASLVSHRFALEEIADAFDVARQGAGLKVLVEMGRGERPPSPTPSPTKGGRAQ